MLRRRARSYKTLVAVPLLVRGLATAITVVIQNSVETRCRALCTWAESTKLRSRTVQSQCDHSAPTDQPLWLLMCWSAGTPAVAALPVAAAPNLTSSSPPRSAALAPGTLNNTSLRPVIPASAEPTSANSTAATSALSNTSNRTVSGPIRPNSTAANAQNASANVSASTEQPQNNTVTVRQPQNTNSSSAAVDAQQHLDHDITTADEDKLGAAQRPKAASNSSNWSAYTVKTPDRTAGNDPCLGIVVIFSPASTF